MVLTTQDLQEQFKLTGEEIEQAKKQNQIYGLLSLKRDE
jgi:hypothetical protein